MEILARAVGRRKEAVAQVQLIRGNGQFIINDKPAQVYLQNNSCSLICIKAPLEAALSLFSNNPAYPSLEGEGANDSLTNSPNKRNVSGESGLDGEQLVQTTLNEKHEVVNFPNSVDNLPIETISSPNSSNREEPLDLSFITSSDSAKEGLGLLTGGGFTTLTSQGEIDIIIKVKGGGLIGQAEAIKLGVARAFCIMENSSGGALIRKILKTKGYLTQDSRVKERRKYGLKKARKASQYHKR